MLAIAEARSESVGIAQVGGHAHRGRRRARPRGRAARSCRPRRSYDRSLANEFQGVFDNIDFGNGSGDGSSGDSGSLDDLPFGRANTWRATLSFSQNLYSGGRIGAQKRLASLGRTTAEQSLVGARAQLRYDVTQAYYDVLLSERLVAIARATLEQAGATLQQTQAGFDAGTQPEFEVLRARVSRDSQTPVLIRQRSNQEVAMLRLKQLLELPADYDLRLADDLGGAQLPPAAVFADAGRSGGGGVGTDAVGGVGAAGRAASRAQRRGRSGHGREPARGRAQGRAGRADAGGELHVELQPDRLSDQRRAGLRPRELVARRRR